MTVGGAMRWVRGAAVALAGLLPVTHPSPAHGVTPSPSDWRDLVIYQIVTDRFWDGDPSNNDADGSYAPSDPYRVHGGDFAGVQSKLDYLVHLGVDAIWISPVVLNANGEFHGYAARDFFAIAPHFGTLGELQSLVAAAHARGIAVLLDVVVNHMGDLISGTGPGYPAFNYPAGYTLSWRNPSKRYVGLLDDLTKFHRYGEIHDYGDSLQATLGELAGLDDLRTEDPAVAALLEQAGFWLMDNTDCDGYRVDTVKHIDNAFWDRWCPAVRAHGQLIGKERFFLFGECFDGIDAKVGSYTGTRAGGSYKFDSMLYFPMFFSAMYTFAYNSSPYNLSYGYSQLGFYDASSRERLVTFLDNHDVARFLSFGVANQDESRMRAALAWLLTARGVPCIYYGSEQEFDGGSDPYDREDMWDGLWDYGPSEGDNFDLVHPLFRFVRSLTHVRRSHEALRRGTTVELISEVFGPGIYAYRRQTDADTVIVTVNTANEPTFAAVPTPWAKGVVVGDALDAAIRDTVCDAGFLIEAVPARGVRIVETLSAQAARIAAEPLQIEAHFPGHDQSLNHLAGPLRVVFDRDVDATSVAAAFGISPPVAGWWQVNGREARFHPAAAWSAGTVYRWSLDATAAGADGKHLAARHDASFKTAPYATGISVPAGYRVDRVARQGLNAPEALLRAPWLGPDLLLLSDTGRDRLFTLTPGADLGHWLGDSRWTAAKGLARGADGALRVCDASGLYAVDACRMTTRSLAPSVATQVGAIAVGGTDFGDAAYLCDPSGDRVVRLGAGGALETFATGINGGNGLAFGPGGAWGADLYVSDADLSSLGTSADGPGRIARVTAGGAVSALATDPGLLGGAAGLAFDPYGAFEGNLYVADILGDRVIQVTPAGEVSLFASGFKNLSGPHCLAFGADGALYVADPGSGQPFSNSNGNNPPSVFRIAPDQPVLGVPAPPGSALALGPPLPNPSRGRVGLRFLLPAGGAVRLEVYDVSGRRVKTLVSRELGPGEHEAAWEGRDEAGRVVGAGLYFARLRALDRTVTRRLVVTR